MIKRLFVYDLDCPVTQRTVLARNLRRRTTTDWQIHWASVWPTSPLPPWATNTSGKKLAFKLAAIQASDDVEFTAYLDGSAIVTGDLEILRKSHADAPFVCLEMAQTLLDCDCFLVNHTAFKSVNGGYPLLTNCNSYEACSAYMPDVRQNFVWDWRPDQNDQKTSTNWMVIRNIEKRPWFNTVGLGASAWNDQLIDALTSGELTKSQVEQDYRGGSIRPSVLTQMRMGGTERIPVATLLDIDSEYVPQPLARDAQQRRLLGSEELENRFREYYRRSRLKKFKKKSFVDAVGATSRNFRKTLHSLLKKVRARSLIRQKKTALRQLHRFKAQLHSFSRLGLKRVRRLVAQRRV